MSIISFLFEKILCFPILLLTNLYLVLLNILNKVRIAVDGDGWDDNGWSIVPGAFLFARNNPEVELVVYVATEEIRRIMDNEDVPKNVILTPTSSFVAANFKAESSLSWMRTLSRDLKDSSMTQWLTDLKNWEVDGFFSAGNTIGFVLLSTSLIKVSSKNMRMALASEFPTPLKPVWLWMDMWANIDISPQHIVQYALLGSEYLYQRYGERYPIGTLNIATEDGKWTELHQQVNSTLRDLEQDLAINYIWNVEPEALITGERKVVVGWASEMNIALKWVKAGSDYTLQRFWDILLPDFLRQRAIDFIKRKVNKSAWAILLWVNKPIAKANGNSTPEMVERTLEELYQYILLEQNSEIISRITQGFDEFYGSIR